MKGNVPVYSGVMLGPNVRRTGSDSESCNDRGFSTGVLVTGHCDSGGGQKRRLESDGIISSSVVRHREARADNDVSIAGDHASNNPQILFTAGGAQFAVCA